MMASLEDTADQMYTKIIFCRLHRVPFSTYVRTLELKMADISQFNLLNSFEQSYERTNCSLSRCLLKLKSHILLWLKFEAIYVLFVLIVSPFSVRRSEGCLQCAKASKVSEWRENRRGVIHWIFKHIWEGLFRSGRKSKSWRLIPFIFQCQLEVFVLNSLILFFTHFRTKSRNYFQHEIFIFFGFNAFTALKLFGRTEMKFVIFYIFRSSCLNKSTLLLRAYS